VQIMTLTRTHHDIAQRQIIGLYRTPSAVPAVLNLIAAGAFYASTLTLVVLCLAIDANAAIKLPVLGISYLACGLAVIKVFTIQHDCGHESYFRQSYLNRLVGRFCSLITFIPFAAWKEEHAEHHACFARIDEQTLGDVALLTVEQFNFAPMWRRIWYRVFRSPLFLFSIAPLGFILFRQRFPSKLRQGRVVSCISHTISITIIYGCLLYLSGFKTLLVFLPPLYVGSAIGIAIFLVEHQFETAEWVNTPEWEFRDAAINASSYIPMPSLIEWITGYIGYHHLHHFSPRIPSYHLKACFGALGSQFPNKPVSLFSIPRTLRLGLWSHDLGRLVTFAEAAMLSR